jgi:metal-dependent HD superfamily phosphatase/phosphodiesterase
MPSMSICLEPECGGNEKLKEVVKRLNSDDEVRALWRASNVTAIDRLGYNDHGPTHIRIVVRTAQKMLHLLVDGGQVPGVVKNYGMKFEDAEVIVTLAASLHDIGHAVHRDKHEEFSIALAAPIIKRLLTGLYEGEAATFMMAEILHAMISHHDEFLPLTVEAGVVRVADALDMEKGRARIPFSAGKANIHSVSALAIEKVTVTKGKDHPVQIDISMSNSAGIFQIDELLREKISRSGLKDQIKIVVHVPKDEKRILHRLEF